MMACFTFRQLCIGYVTSSYFKEVRWFKNNRRFTHPKDFHLLSIIRIIAVGLIRVRNKDLNLH